MEGDPEFPLPVCYQDVPTAAGQFPDPVPEVPQRLFGPHDPLAAYREAEKRAAFQRATLLFFSLTVRCSFFSRNRRRLTVTRSPVRSVRTNTRKSSAYREKT